MSVALWLAAVALAQAPLKLPEKTTDKPAHKLERWEVKTSVPSGAKLETPKVVKLSDLLALGDAKDCSHNDARYDAARIPGCSNSLGLVEGDIVQTSGWLHLVAREDDGDFHVQLSDSAASGSPCFIVEVPNPDPKVVAAADLRPLATGARSFLQGQLPGGKAPSTAGTVLKAPVYVTITGQLFFDDSHVGDPPRGKQGMHAGTLWELHPVVKAEAAKSGP